MYLSTYYSHCNYNVHAAHSYNDGLQWFNIMLRRNWQPDTKHNLLAQYDIWPTCTHLLPGRHLSERHVTVSSRMDAYLDVIQARQYPKLVVSLLSAQYAPKLIAKRRRCSLCSQRVSAQTAAQTAFVRFEFSRFSNLLNDVRFIVLGGRYCGTRLPENE